MHSCGVLADFGKELDNPVSGNSVGGTGSRCPMPGARCPVPVVRCSVPDRPIGKSTRWPIDLETK